MLILGSIFYEFLKHNNKLLFIIHNSEKQKKVGCCKISIRTCALKSQEFLHKFVQQLEHANKKLKKKKKMKQIKSMTFKSQTLDVDFWILKMFINPFFALKKPKQ